MNVHAYICANTHKRVLNSKHKRAPAFVRGGGGAVLNLKQI